MPEDVLVVPRAHLLPSGDLHGFAVRDVSSYLSAIAALSVPRARVAHFGREATTSRPSASIIAW